MKKFIAALIVGLMLAFTVIGVSAETPLKQDNTMSQTTQMKKMKHHRHHRKMMRKHHRKMMKHHRKMMKKNMK